MGAGDRAPRRRSTNAVYSKINCPSSSEESDESDEEPAAPSFPYMDIPLAPTFRPSAVRLTYELPSPCVNTL